MTRKWKFLLKINKTSAKVLKKYPAIVQQLLFNRGIKKAKEAEEFLDPDYQKFYTPLKLYNSKKAAKLILRAIKDKKRIFIHGDFDVDGICATSILWDFLYRQLGADVMPYVPSRFDEGYGMSDESLSNIKKQGGEFIITVDCGIKDDELIKKWEKKGLEFIVTDHHELKRLIKADKKPDYAEATSGKQMKADGKEIKADGYLLPKDALATVHPRYPKHEYPFTDISGATVVWKLVNVLVKEAALDINPDVYLDLVALSVVCDVVPLIDENRYILKSGLKQIQKTNRIGLRRLIYDAGLEPTNIDVYHLGFIIGPRLNAAGRLDHAIDAIRLLSTSDPVQAREISEKLNHLNQKRQRIQQDIYDEALKQIEDKGIDRKLFFVWGEEWAEGVIGIVAGKISENYRRPVLVATKTGNGFKGSARSIDEFNIINAINSQSELLEHFGGHPLAAGFTVKAENIEQFRDNLLEIADRELTDEKMEKEVVAEAEVELRDINWDFFEWIERFSPFGYGNLKPRFILKNVELADISRVGTDGAHLRIALLNKDTGEYTGGIGFGLGKEFAHLTLDDKIDLLFTLEINEWNGTRKLQLNIKDLKDNRD